MVRMLNNSKEGSHLMTMKPPVRYATRHANHATMPLSFEYFRVTQNWEYTWGVPAENGSVDAIGRLRGT